MDLLVVLGTTAAYAFSVYNTFVSGDHAKIYFESSALLITLILLGRFLEARARFRTTDAIRTLIGLTPSTARVIRNGSEIEIPASDVLPGDRIVIRPGERIPADGIVESGESSC